ncbi:TolC family protein [Cyclobacterium plantarum]|jgi:outer membrane protein TolC|uniref:TolC family protein n=1 Tax=Cyclobacterium plantarum TaxID=2716263 RepID=A0ABX0H2B5_9BACT|nr:TolC family protein [Cyclobacterium plantarum]NHE55935.1 TolC family protein [Cyclobacterium plantarum]
MKKFILIICIAMGFHFSGNAQTLEDYFQIAAENNPGLLAKYKNFEAAIQRVTQVSTLPDPNLSFGYFISPVETRVGPQQARFSLTQMFPWFGTLSAQKDAASLLAEAKYQEFLDARNKLYYQVAASYYPLYELEKLISIEAENQRILSSYKEIATVQFQNDKGSMVDALRVDIMLKDATTELSILNQKKKPLETRFNKLLNRDENESIEIIDSLQIKRIIPDFRKDSLLLANPLLEELDLKVQASQAQERAAIKQGLPKFGVGLDYVIVGERTDATISDNGKDVLMPMVTMSLPIFRGKYKAAQNEAQLMQESYEFQKEEVSNRLISSYEMIWFEIQKQLKLIELFEEQIQESEQSLNLLFSAYSNSGKEFEEVLRMQQQILKYQRLKATALSDYHITLAELDYITAKNK